MEVPIHYLFCPYRKSWRRNRARKTKELLQGTTKELLQYLLHLKGILRSWQTNHRHQKKEAYEKMWG